MDYDYNRSFRRFCLSDTVQEAPKPVLVERKKRGRGPKVTASTPEIVPQTPFDDKPPTPIPAKPDHSRVPSPAKRLLPAKEMFEYWHSVPEPERSAWFIAYVYRKYPFCDVYQPFSKEELLVFQNNKGKKRIPWQGKILERPDSNCGSLSQPLDPDTWEQQIYERWGAGDYQIRLNDQHESVHETVTECHIRNLRDWDKYPPVLELNTVVLADEGNQPYIRWARLKGIKFPGDAETEQATREGEDIEMASVVETMARQNEALTDKVVEMAERRQAQTPSAGTPPVDVAARAQLGGIETVVDASKQGFKMLGDAMTQLTQNQIKSADPGEQLKQAVEIAKLMAPASSGSSDLVKIMELQLTQTREEAKRQLDQQEKNFSRLLESEREHHKEMLGMLTSRLDAMEKQKTEPVSKEEDALKTYGRIRALVRDLQEEDEPADAGPAWLAPVLGLGEKVIQGIADTTRNLAAMRANQSPGGPVIQDVGPELPPTPPQAQPPKDAEMDMRRQYAMQLHKPLIDAIKAGRSGSDFAAAIIAEAGQPAYEMAVAQGYDGLAKILQAHPPLWEELVMPPIGHAAVDKFVNEFLDRARVMEALQMLKGQGQPGQPPVHKGPKVNQ